MIHVFQVHKESIDAVPHSKKGRDSFELDIFGMVGVPADLIQEKMVKIYGEPAAKKQKVDHMQPMGRVQFPGVGAPNQQMLAPMAPMPFMYSRMQPGMPGLVQMGRGMPIMPLQRLQPQMLRTGQPGQQMMPGSPMMPRQHHPQMVQRPQQMLQPAVPTRPIAMPQMQPGQQQMAPKPGMLPQGMPAPTGVPPQNSPQIGIPGQIPSQTIQMQPNQLPPQAHPAPPPPTNQVQMVKPQPGMIPQIQQTPISASAKTEAVDRQDHLVNQQSVVKKASKKKINRIYEEVNVSMEENRARHHKYQYL